MLDDWEISSTNTDSLQSLIATTAFMSDLRRRDEERRLYEAQNKQLKLDLLLTSIKNRYPRSSHADFADEMLKALIDLRPEGGLPEESAVDSIRVESIVTDSTGADSTEVVAQAGQEAEPSPEDPLLVGVGQIDTAGAGWTLIVASFSERERAEVVRLEYEEKGFITGVLQGATRFRVGVGQFPDLDYARTALANYKEQLPPTTWFLDIEKPK